jgi:hypothetical protein
MSSDHDSGDPGAAARHRNCDQIDYRSAPAPQQ